MKIGIAADHAGFALKEELKKFLSETGHEVTDFGARSHDPSDDYPDFIFLAARAVARNEMDRTIVIGSSGQGEGMVANRIKGVRAMVYYGSVEPLSGTAKVGTQKGIIESAREDNDSNVLALGASFVSADEAKRVIEKWLALPFSSEERHKRRIEKLDSTRS